MIKYILILSFLHFAFIRSSSQNPSIISTRDSSIVGKVIEFDSIKLMPVHDYFGVIYYYGVHHIKIRMLDIRDDTFTDTILIAYVYNTRTELDKYKKNFGMKKGETYGFFVSTFEPCDSDFPRLQGICREDGTFKPSSNSNIKSYRTILRVIDLFKYK